jgi:hypothetical protein
MRELHHYIIKSNSNRSTLIPVYIHHDCTTDLDYDTLNSIGRYIEGNLEYIESCARCNGNNSSSNSSSSSSSSSLLQFRETLVSPASFDQMHAKDHKIHFAIKKQSKYYTTILYDTEHGNATFLTSTTLYLCAFELYLFISL